MLPYIWAQDIMAQERKNIVKELRSIARLCGVELVRDDASREKVTQMVQKSREARPAPDLLKKLVDTEVAYLKTFGETATWVREEKC